MRLTCPNCNAQYEIAEDVIPADGRDVQCSNCGTTWFQKGRARPVTAAEERAVRRPAQTTDAVEDEAEIETEVAEAPPAAPADAAPRPVADDDTLDILREERAHEARRRAAQRRGRDGGDPTAAAEDEREAAAAERARMAAAAEVARAREDHPTDAPSAPEDGGYDEPSRETEDDSVAGAIAQAMRDAQADPDDDVVGTTGVAAGAAAASRANRRELLPDIEEINSSLRPDERAAEAEADDQDEQGQPERRSTGFRIGFVAISALILAFVALYVFADAIGEAVPAAAEPLAAYVDWVDSRRLALEAGVDGLVDSIEPDS